VSDVTAPLSDLLVLDFTRVLAGPYCTRLLADLGARVVKIERAKGGDDMRKGHLQLDANRDDQSTYFTRINVGKQSVGLDLGRPETRDVVCDLARKADVAVENFAPGVAQRLGIDYPTLAAIKPDLVYCSISGFGQTGPWRERPAFAHIIHAASGLMHLEQGELAAPRSANLQAADVLAGTHAFGAIMAALWRRARTGEGARLDVSMLEALIAADDVSIAAGLNGGEKIGAPRPGMGVYEVGGRHLALQVVGSTDLWPRLLTMMKRPELANDPRFATPVARRENWPLLRDLIGQWLTRFRTVDEAVAALGDARIPCAPVLEPHEVIAHPHLLERGAFPEVPHPTRGSVRVTASPYHWDGKPVHPAGGAPYRVGEHSRLVLSGLLGYDAERIDKLIAAGAVEAP
jgi:crotonobetainyl-CoA:carnitine CoA-transferase CaiB-like acyl-CoA transferase